MIYVKVFTNDNRLDMEDRINEWLGAQRAGTDFFNVKNTHYSVASIEHDLIHCCMIFYELHLSAESQ